MAVTTMSWVRRGRLCLIAVAITAVVAAGLIYYVPYVELDLTFVLDFLPRPSLYHPTPFGRELGGTKQFPFLYPQAGRNSSTAATYNYTLPLRTRGRYIVDAHDDPVKLASINWYGASDILFIPSGLDKQPRDDIARLIRDLGFNSVRLPYSDEMVRDNPWIAGSLLAANRDLIHEDTGGAPALEVYTAVVNSLTAAGLMVIVNNHITQSTWCCGANPCDAGWANDWFGGGRFCRVGQTVDEWLEHWERVMRPLAHNPRVVGVDLRNEPRGLWGTLHWDDWAAVAETAAKRLLAIHPDWLVIVEGIASANDLTEVRARPVQLQAPFPADRIVYSAHVYAWSGWGSLNPYSRRSYDDFVLEMRRNWAYLLEEDLAPVWIGEFGTPENPSAGDLNYWTHLVEFLRETDVSWAYWAINPRKPAHNEQESYGLVGDNWDRDAVRWDHRLESMRLLGLRPNIRPPPGTFAE
jgi:endoglucanase